MHDAKQCDTSNVLVAVDLENMFNAVGRDALVDELRRHELLQPLARYVVALYPPGMISVAKVAGEWRRISMERGLAQGRCLSPVLSSVLLQPCIVAAEDAMVRAVGVSRQEFRRTCGVAAYLDDLSIVAPPAVAAVGLRTFQAAVAVTDETNERQVAQNPNPIDLTAAIDAMRAEMEPTMAQQRIGAEWEPGQARQ